MPNAAHSPRSPPTADEKAEKMRRAQDPDLAFSEALLQARQRIQRTHPPEESCKRMTYRKRAARESMGRKSQPAAWGLAVASEIYECR